MNFPTPPNAHDANLPPQQQQQSSRHQPQSAPSHQVQQQQQQFGPQHQQPQGQQQQQFAQNLQNQHQSQQQQQQQQHHSMMNGMNGGGMGGGMPLPTPAGHQAELNYIYGMVEELSKQLAENRRVTEDIVSGLGRVRSRARAQGLHNDQVLDAAAEGINGMQHCGMIYCPPNHKNKTPR